MPIDLNKLRATYQELVAKETTKSNSTGDSFLKVELGANFIRILPPKKEDENFYSVTKIHTVKKPDGTFRYWHCRRVHNEPCPMCDAYREMWAQHKIGNQEVAEIFGKGNFSIKPKDRYYVNVVNRKDDTVKVAALAPKLFQKVMISMLGSTELGIDPLGDITDLKNGYDFNIVATKQGEYMNFDQSQCKTKSTPAAPNAQRTSQYIDECHDLKALVKLEDYEEMKLEADAILSGVYLRNAPKSNSTTAPATEAVSDEEFKKRIQG